MQSARIALAEHKAPLLPPRQMLLVKQQPLPKTEAIIFDMDGVLVESRKAAARALATVARQEGVSMNGTAIEIALDRGNSAASIVALLLPHLNGKPEELDRVARTYTQASLGNMKMIKKTAIARCLPMLSRKFSLAVATNRTQGAALEILDRLEMRTFFGAVVTLADAPPKPDPKMLFLAIMQIGASIASSIFVGDKPSDYQAGEAAGVRTIMVDACKGRIGCEPFLSEFWESK